jgi:hypothetical protein
LAIRSNWTMDGNMPQRLDPLKRGLQQAIRRDFAAPLRPVQSLTRRYYGGGASGRDDLVAIGPAGRDAIQRLVGGVEFIE